MGYNITKQSIIDSETGEVLTEKSFFNYDGFNDKGYKYRYRAKFARVYLDSVPETLSKESLLLLVILSNIANDENVFVYRVTRKSKFSSIIYKPMTKEDIYKKIPKKYKYGINKFNKCWQELKKHCIKQVEYYDNTLVWAMNPAIISNCQQVPAWLYNEFSLYMNPYLTPLVIKKYNDILSKY